MVEVKYSVLDMRTRETVGSVTGETDEECLKKARDTYESQSRRVVAFPETELTEALSEKEVQSTRSGQPTYLQLTLVVDASRQQLIDERYTGEDFGFEPGKALVLKRAQAEYALTSWARQALGLGTNYIARMQVSEERDLVVVVSEKTNGAG